MCFKSFLSVTVSVEENGFDDRSKVKKDGLSMMKSWDPYFLGAGYINDQLPSTKNLHQDALITIDYCTVIFHPIVQMSCWEPCSIQ